MPSRRGGQSRCWRQGPRSSRRCREILAARPATELRAIPTGSHVSGGRSVGKPRITQAASSPHRRKFPFTANGLRQGDRTQTLREILADANRPRLRRAIVGADAVTYLRSPPSRWNSALGGRHRPISDPIRRSLSRKEAAMGLWPALHPYVTFQDAAPVGSSWP